MGQITENDLVNITKFQTLLERACEDISEMKTNINTILGNCQIEKLSQQSSCFEITNVKKDVNDIKEFMSRWGNRAWIIVSGVIISLVLSGGMWLYNIDSQYKNTEKSTLNSTNISSLQDYNKTNPNPTTTNKLK